MICAIIAGTGEVYNAARHLGDGSRPIHCDRVGFYASAVRAILNTPEFLTETSLVAEEDSLCMGQVFVDIHCKKS